MFEKILIANRGEIACRVIRTARRMGIATVAVCSEADQGALHVEMADERVAIGPAPAAESYLRAERIVEACRATGAEAVHPGYGFLSENADFAAALAEAGITFIGPGGEAMRAMGDKIASKRIAAEAGVSTIPGHAGVIEDAGHALRVAAEIGYPVMLKASAGGGGKGMRIARDQEECRQGFARATSEALSSFGDGRILIEKFIERPRHIEIQVLADGHGNVLYLGERECSVQRRHQKVIEEAPSPFLDAATRRAMGEQACALARAVGYRSAGTVEFIAAPDRSFYFLEMNTRLQVEHPVTEMVTGLDLVEWMIRIAAGEALPFAQEEVRVSGWAIEARVYAEDPTRGFLPSTGRLVRYREPSASERVRVDSGVAEGGEISMFYDPMIAKLIGYGPDREAAIATLRGALDRYLVRGVAHNIGFLRALLGRASFCAGDLHTGLIDQEFPDGYRASELPAAMVTLFAVVAGFCHDTLERRAARISGQLAGRARRLDGRWVALVGDERRAVQVRRGEGGCEVEAEGGVWRLESAWVPGEALLEVAVNDAPLAFQVEPEGPALRLHHGGYQARVLVLTERGAELHALMPAKAPPDTSRFLLSPMPGLLSAVLVAPGDPVQTGQDLAIVEAMKMENVLRAERDGTVAAVLAEPGASLTVDQPILEFR